MQAADIAGAAVKGAVAAERLYPDASLRTFTDVDVPLMLDAGVAFS